MKSETEIRDLLNVYLEDRRILVTHLEQARKEHEQQCKAKGMGNSSKIEHYSMMISDKDIQIETLKSIL